MKKNPRLLLDRGENPLKEAANIVHARRSLRHAGIINTASPFQGIRMADHEHPLNISANRVFGKYNVYNIILWFRVQ
jgi:hypothetical protein